MVGNKRKSLINKNKIICLQCKTEVLESEDCLQCDGCNKNLHSICTKMDKKRIDKLLNNPSLEYKCHFCEPNESNVVVRELAEIKTKLNQLDDIREAVKFMSSQYDSILKGLATNTKKINSLQTENNLLRDEVKQLKSSVKYLNDIRVQNDCIVNGVKVTDGALKAVDVVLDIAKKIGADICENEIKDAYFLPNRNKKNEKKSIVMKFTNKKSKKVFMNEKSKMKKMDDLKTVYVNDLMCRETLDVFNHAKSLKTVGYKFVYARGGNIVAKKTFESNPIRIKSMDDVDRILTASAGGSKRGRTSAVVIVDGDGDGDNGDSNDDDEEGDGIAFQSPE